MHNQEVDGGRERRRLHLPSAFLLTGYHKLFPKFPRRGVPGGGGGSFGLLPKILLSGLFHITGLRDAGFVFRDGALPAPTPPMSGK